MKADPPKPYLPVVSLTVRQMDLKSSQVQPFRGGSTPASSRTEGL